MAEDKIEQERQALAEMLRQKMTQARDVANAEHDARQAARRGSPIKR
jgi:hypothetical protein